MTIILAADAPWAGAALAPDHRPRVGNATRTIVAESVVMSERPRSAQERRRDRKRTEGPLDPVLEISDQETAFAASVIAASLPPAPAPVEEAIQRIAEAKSDEPTSHLRDRLA